MSSMLLAHDEGGEDLYVSIPLGGPIYVQDMVGPPTRVPDFETSVFQELESLKELLSGDSSETCGEEISVDELKIISEDELVSKAFEEAFKQDDELAIDAPKVSEDNFEAQVRKTDDNSLQNSEGDMKAIVLIEPSNAVPLKNCDKKKSSKSSARKRKKGKRDTKKNNSFDESYITKVEQLAKIKQKQEEDKAAVRLHSFEVPGCSTTTKANKIKSLKSGSVSTKVRASNTCDNIPVQFPETVLCFEVYHNRKTWLKTQEFLVLGRQFLTEVRDKIYCLTDEIIKKAGQYDPSGYFLIEKCLCRILFTMI